MNTIRRFLMIATAVAAISAPVAFAQESDLLVEKTGPVQAAADTDVTYTVTITNLGPDPASTLTLNDNTPTGQPTGAMTFFSHVAPGGFSCSTPTAGSTGLITCTGGPLAAGSSVVFTFVFHIPPATAPGTTFTNIANVTCATDPNGENNSGVASTSTPPPPQADVAVTKSGPNAAGADTDVAFTLTLANGGPDPAQDATLTDTLPGNMTFVSMVQNSGPAVPCTTPSPGSGGAITCSTSPGNLAAGATATFTLTGHIPPGTPSGTTYINVVTGSTATNDLNAENNTSQASLSVTNVDVGITKTGPATVPAGTDITYTLTVSNTGPDSATNVSFADTLPPGTTFVSLNQTGTPTANCATPQVGSPGNVICTFSAPLPNPTSTQFTLVINSGSATSVTNDVTIGTDSFDTDPSNNSASATTTVTQSADIAVAKNGPATATSGSNVQYTITVTDTAGPSNAANVTLTDALPPNTTFVSMTQTGGPTFNCTGSTCIIATLPFGASATFTLIAHVASSVASGSGLLNTANVSTTTSDPISANDTATTTATTTTSADVSVAKTGPASAPAGTNVTYVVTVTNAGPSDAQNVSVTDAPGPDTTFVSMTQTSGPTFTCVSMTCTIASLAASSTATFDVVLAVSPTATGTITNSATATSTTTDPTPGNGSASAGVIVDPGTTDMSISKTANGTRFLGGSNVTYTIVVTNNGPTTAANVVVTDPIPPGTGFVSATPTQGSCSGTTTVVCTLGTMAPTAQATITLIITLPNTQGTFSNTATVTAANSESNPANNASTAAVAVFSDIPALSPLSLALLAIVLAGVGFVVQRR